MVLRIRCRRCGSHKVRFTTHNNPPGSPHGAICAECAHPLSRFDLLPHPPGRPPQYASDPEISRADASP